MGCILSVFHGVGAAMSADNTPGLGRGNEGDVYQILNGRAQFAPVPTGLAFGTHISPDLGPHGAATRDIGHIYHNTTGKPLMVLVDVELTANNTAGGSSAAQVDALIGAASPPTQIVTDLYLYNDVYAPPPVSGFESEIFTECQVVLMVPRGWYYELRDYSGATGTSTCWRWYEVQ